MRPPLVRKPGNIAFYCYSPRRSEKPNFRARPPKYLAVPWEESYFSHTRSGPLVGDLSKRAVKRVGGRICNFSIITIEMAGEGPYNTHE
jgi:anaerobic selenocysteine-containing dehydrogenase